MGGEESRGGDLFVYLFISSIYRLKVGYRVS